MTWAKPPARQRQYEGEGAKPRMQSGEIAHRAQALRIETAAKLCVPLPKRQYLRSEPFRRWVASLDCAHCGRAGPSQAAHSDASRDGKGLGIKSTDAALWPGCADAPGRVGCHTLIGSSGRFSRAQSQALAATYIARTQAKAVTDGVWPAVFPFRCNSEK